MSTVFVINAYHISPMYRVRHLAITLDSQTRGTGFVRCHSPMCFSAYLEKFGFSRFRDTAEEAIRDLLTETGCTNITIETVLVINAQ